jgi:hypothetical protein
VVELVVTKLCHCIFKHELFRQYARRQPQIFSGPLAVKQLQSSLPLAQLAPGRFIPMPKDVVKDSLSELVP